MQVKSLQVLVVDDDADASESMAEVLQMYDVRAHRRDGAYRPRCFKRRSRSRPNRVLMDLAMPEMDGHQVAALIRREPSLDLTLLVAVTGGSRNEDQRAAND